MKKETTITELKEFIKKEMNKDKARMMTWTTLDTALKVIEKAEERMGQ